MKSLPLLVFAAFAACVPGTRASGYRTLTTLPEELQGTIMANLPQTDQASYAAIDRKAHDAAKKRSEILFPINIQNMFKGLGMPIPMAIASLFNPKKEASVHDQYISISDIINMMGLEKLKGNTQVAKELTSLALPSPGSTNSHLIGDPRGLLMLFREDMYNPDVRNLFKQNAEQFKGGLGIDESWIDNDLLSWFTAGLKFDSRYPIPITLSYDDVVALMCHSIFSSPTPPSSKARLPGDKVNKIMEDMSALLWNLHNQPTLETLSKLKMVPLKTDSVAFDLTAGLKHCIAQRPSAYTLLDGLELLVANKTPALDLKRFVIRSMFFDDFVMEAGMDIEDMFQSMCEHKSVVSFKIAVSVMCKDTQKGHDSYDCSKSKYFMNTPGNGVLGWKTLSWVLHKVLERRLYRNARDMLSLFAGYSLLPAHAPAESEIFQSAIKVLKSTKDGRELNAAGKDKLEYLLTGKKPSESQISKEDKESESDKGPRRRWISEMLAKLPGNKKP